MYEIKHKCIKIPEGRVYYHDLNGNVVVKRSNPVVTRYIRLDSIDGEQYFYQLLLLNINFRSFGKLISDANLTKTYKEEAIIRGLFYEDESDVIQIDLEKIIARIMQNLISNKLHKRCVWP
jgi:hypothetical protein